MVKFDRNASLIEEIGPAIDRAFIEAVKSLSLSPEIVRKHADYPLVYTPIHGTGVRIVPRALEVWLYTSGTRTRARPRIAIFPRFILLNPEEPVTS